MGNFYNNFLTALEERYPNKSDLVNALTELIYLEKESIYRRLRKDVYFSAEEMMRIAKAWNISLDNIISANSSRTHTFQLNMIDFTDTTDYDYAILEQHNRDLELIASDPKSMAVEMVNSLQRGLYARSEPLARFFTMKWRYKYAPDKVINFGNTQISERMKELDREYIKLEQSIPEMHSINDPRIIENIVGEIVYYRSIGMLTYDDSILLRDELLALVDYMENVTLTGYYPNSNNKRLIYLSHTWIENEYLLFKSQHLNISLLRVLERNFIFSFDKNVIDRFIKMALAAKRMSVLMSESNTLKQVEFFARQRIIIRTLSNDC